MNTCRTLLFFTVVAVLSLFFHETTYADVFPSNVRITQPGSTAPFDGRFDDGTGAAIRFVLSDRADSVVIDITLGVTPVRTIRALSYTRGDTSVIWDGLNNGGLPVGNGSYSVKITTYDQGYGAYTTIYDVDHGLFTRGVTAIKNPASKNFGFIYTADNGGYGGLGTGIMRHAADGTRWGDVKGLPKVANTGAVVGPANLRYSSEADWEGYVYLIGRDNREIYRYHTDTVNVAMVDSGGYRPYIIEGLAIRGTGAGRYIGVAGQFNVYGFLLGNNATHFGSKDWLLASDSIYQFNDVAFGRDSMMYATFYSRVGDSAKPGVAKFDLTGYTGTPLRLTDALWKATVDSGRANTLTYYRNPAATDESGDRIYFVNVDIAGSGNPGFGVGVHAITNLDSTQPTVTTVYSDLDQNNTQFRSDVTADVVGNAIYFENTTENVAIISPPTGPNSYSFDAPARIRVIQSESIAAVRIDTLGGANFRPDRLGDTVNVVGIVGSTNFTTSANRFSYNIQDGTGGINITKGSETGGGPVYSIGTRLLVRGVVGQFRGLTQLDIPAPLSSNVEVLDSGHTVTPVLLTLDQLLANPEAYESQLIKINYVAKTSASVAWPLPGLDANMTIWDGFRSLVLRVDLDTDLDDNPEPTYPMNVIGTATQFTSSSSVFNDGYQITPSFYADITQGVQAPPNPNFPLLTPANSSTIVLDSTTQTVEFKWRKAVDLNNDPLIYQWVPVGFTAISTGNAAADTFLVRTGAQLLTYMGTADTVNLRWSARTKDTPNPIVNNVDTFTVRLVRGTIVDVGEQELLPQAFALDQNYPNPFNPTTTIRYALPKDAYVSLKIYDILGAEVAQLTDGIQPVGVHTIEWNGKNKFGAKVASGMYFYRMEARATDNSETFSNIKKMLLLK